MAAASPTYEDIKKQIASRKLAPVYIISGKEGYFADQLVKEFEKIIPEEDKEFNQYVLYAPQVMPGQVMDICSRFPMMAERQLVILKEAQEVRADAVNKLARYAENPSSTTVLVIVFRGEKAAGKDLIAAVKKKGVFFESKEVRDYQIGPYITAYVKEKGMSIDPKAMEMLKEFIGGSVSNMYNELDKLHIILGKGATITPEAVERNIGISKEYNTFELIDAIAVKNSAKVMRIASYFASNPKLYPVQKILPSIYEFFSNLLILYYAKDKTTAGLMKELNFKAEWQLKNYRGAMQQYNAYQVIEIIWALRQCDLRCKGSGSRQDAHDLLHELLFHILSAPGNLGVDNLGFDSSFASN